VIGAVPPRATFREVFAVREFRVLWSSVALSTAGDRLALVALTLLVYDRTKSPLLAAVVYAVGYLPWVIGGLFLAELADRHPRRSVMVFCDAARAVLVAAMVVPGMPIGALVALLFAATMFALWLVHLRIRNAAIVDVGWAAGLATLDLYRDEKLFERAKKLEPLWADAAMALKSVPGVLDIRTVGLTAGIDLASRPDAFGKRAYEAMERGFHDEGVMVRITGETLALTPPLIVSEDQIGEIVERVAKVIRAVA